MASQEAEIIQMYFFFLSLTSTLTRVFKANAMYEGSFYEPPIEARIKLEDTVQ